MICNEIKGEFCNTFYYHTIEGTLPVMAQSLYNVSGIVLSTLAVDEYVANLFSGTNNGFVHKIQIHHGVSKTFIHNGTYEMNSNILDIQVNDEMVYILTNSKLQRLHVNDCSFDDACTKDSLENSSCVLSTSCFALLFSVTILVVTL